MLFSYCHLFEKSSVLEFYNVGVIWMILDSQMIVLEAFTCMCVCVYTIKIHNPI